MSDGGYLAADNGCAGPIESAVSAERAAIAAYGATYQAGIDGLVEKQRLSAAEATTLKRRIGAFVEAIVQGLHRG